MSDTTLATSSPSAMMENVLINGDLSGLSHEQRVSYYMKVCDSIGLNPLTKPFDYLVLDGKTVLYAKKDATDQLRQSRNVSIIGLDKERIDDVFVVTSHAQTPDGRTDTSTGVVSLVKEDGEWKEASSGKRYFKGNGNWMPLRGDALANAMMKAETKAKRRVTLSICGLGMLDETEIETIPDARPFMEQLPAAQSTKPTIFAIPTAEQIKPYWPALAKTTWDSAILVKENDKNGNCKFYVDLPSEVLSKKSEGINVYLKTPGLTPEQIADATYKHELTGYILVARAAYAK